MTAYGCEDLVYDGSMKVDPDTFLYFYHKDTKQYVLLDTDYLGQDANLDYPYMLDFNYYKDKSISLMVKNNVPSANNKITAGTILFER